MIRMRKKWIVFVVLLVCAVNGKSQGYKTALGLRAGLGYGVTVKHSIKDNIAIEGIVQSRWRGANFVGLYEIYHNAFDVPHLHWYYGFGGHIGFWNNNYIHPHRTYYGNGYTVLGVDGIIAIEYNFQEVPVNISLDWKPEINIIGYRGFWADAGALSVRYIF